MTWNIHHKATAEQSTALAAAAVRFCGRHGIDAGDDAMASVQFACEAYPSASNDHNWRAARLNRLWRVICKRITGSADGIAYGYVGNTVR